MAQLKISQQPFMEWGDELIAMIPKPTQYQRRIPVTVPDEVVKQKQVQPVLDAYAVSVHKPDWVGKDQDWYKKEQHLGLGFHIISFDDGTPVQ
jgi:hypothetical protein